MQLPGQFMSLLDVARFLVNPSPPQPDPIAYGGFVGPTPIQQFKDQNGKPLAYGKLYSYVTGTDTPLSLYANASESTTLSNPIVFDAYGRTTYFLTPEMAYKLVLTDADDVMILTRDPVIVPWIAAAPPTNDPPPGAIYWYASPVSPVGWLFCLGQYVEIAAYPTLFSAIGQNYSQGIELEDHFRLPHLVGRFMLGQSTLGTGSVLGEVGGIIDHTHILPSHVHTMAHTHSLPRDGWGSVSMGAGVSGRLLVGPGTNIYQPTGDNVTASQSAASTGTTTLTSAGNNPPLIALTCIIKT